MKLKLNKKAKKVLLLLGGILLLTFIIFFFVSSCKSSDGARFKQEYEKYNNKSSEDGNKYQKLKISKNNKVKYITATEAIDILKNKTGLIYMGFPNCPWCRGMLPTLLDTVKKSNQRELYYLDMTGIRDTYEVKDYEVKKTGDGTPEYLDLLNLLDNYLDEYIIKDEDNFEYEVGEKRIYVPLVVAVQDGYIQGVHSNSVELEENQSPYDKLTDKQNQELEVALNNLIDTLNVNQ